MNWFDNVSSDSDQPIAPARLVQGHWLHPIHPFSDPVMCRVVVDLSEPRVVAAQVMDHGMVEDLGSSALEDMTQAMVAQNVHLHPRSWGLSTCTMLPDWARPSFSESQIAELERIEGYLIDASDDNIDDVLRLRDEFLRGIGMTDQDVMRAARSPEQAPCGRKGGRLVN